MLDSVTFPICIGLLRLKVMDKSRALECHDIAIWTSFLRSAYPKVLLPDPFHCLDWAFRDRLPLVDRSVGGHKHNECATFDYAVLGAFSQLLLCSIEVLSDRGAVGFNLGDVYFGAAFGLASGSRLRGKKTF